MIYQKHKSSVVSIQVAALLLSILGSLMLALPAVAQRGEQPTLPGAGNSTSNPTEHKDSTTNPTNDQLPNSSEAGNSTSSQTGSDDSQTNSTGNQLHTDGGTEELLPERTKPKPPVPDQSIVTGDPVPGLW